MRLSTQGVLLSGANIVTFLVQLIIGVFLARFFSREDYGTFLQVNLILTISMSILFFAIPKSVYYYFPLFSENEKPWFALQTVLVLILLSGFGGIILFTSKSFIANGMNNPVLASFGLFFLFLPLLMIFDSLFSDFFVALKMAHYAAIRKMLFGISATILVLLLVSKLKSVSSVFVGISIVYTIELFVLILFIFKLFTHTKLAKFKSYHWQVKLKDQLSYSFPLWLGGVAGLLSLYLNQFFAAKMFSVEEFAIFARGISPLPFESLIVFPLFAVLLPRMVELQHQGKISELLTMVHEVARKIALVMYPLFVFQMVFAKEIMVFLFSEKYEASSIYYQISLVPMLFSVAAYGNFLQAFRKNSWIMTNIYVALIISLAFLFLLSKFFGLIGLALAPLVALILCIVFLWTRQFSKVANISWVQTFPFRELGVILLCAVLTVTPCFLMKWLPIPLFFKLPLSFLIFSIFYFVVVAKGKMLVRDDLYFMNRFKWFPWKLLFGNG